MRSPDSALGVIVAIDNQAILAETMVRSDAQNSLNPRVVRGAQEDLVHMGAYRGALELLKRILSGEPMEIKDFGGRVALTEPLVIPGADVVRGSSGEFSSYLKADHASVYDPRQALGGPQDY